MRKVLVATCVAAALLAGCGPAGRTPDAQPRGDASISAGSSGSGGSKGTEAPPAGIVWISKDGVSRRFGVFDPVTGALLHVSMLPASVGAIGLSTRSFTADRKFLTSNYLVNGSLCSIIVLKWTGFEYREHAVLDPRASFSGGKLCYGIPQVRAGRIWATLGEPKLPSNNPPQKVVSIDPADPKAPARVEQENVTMVSSEATVQGGQMEPVQIRTLGGRPEGFDVRGRLDIQTGEHVKANYACDQRVDDATVLCLGYGPFGSVAFAKLDVAARTIAMTLVVPESPAKLAVAMLSPDGKQVLLRTNNGWFRADVGGTKEPARMFDKLQFPPDVGDPDFFPASQWYGWI